MKDEQYPYLLITEYKGTGYVIGYFRTLKATEEEIEAYIHYYEEQKKLMGSGTSLNDNAMETFKVHQSCVYATPVFENCITDGSYSLYIVDTRKKNFKLKNLIWERGNTVFAFEIGAYPDSKYLEEVGTDFIAN
jgi:hypothetical protein